MKLNVWWTASLLFPRYIDESYSVVILGIYVNDILCWTCSFAMEVTDQCAACSRMTDRNYFSKSPWWIWSKWAALLRIFAMAFPSPFLASFFICLFVCCSLLLSFCSVMRLTNEEKNQHSISLWQKENGNENIVQLESSAHRKYTKRNKQSTGVSVIRKRFVSLAVVSYCTFCQLSLSLRKEICHRKWTIFPEHGHQAMCKCSNNATHEDNIKQQINFD